MGGQAKARERREARVAKERLENARDNAGMAALLGAILMSGDSTHNPTTAIGTARQLMDEALEEFGLPATEGAEQSTERSEVTPS